MTRQPATAEDIRALWRTLPTDNIAISAGDMRAKSRKFQNRIRLRNFIEYGAFLIVAVAFGYQSWTAPNWQAATAGVLMIAGGALSVWNLHRRGRAVETPDDASTTAMIAFQRGELRRQRDALASVWSWYLLPFVPGFAWFSVIAWLGYLENDMPLAEQQAKVFVFLLVLAGVFIIVLLLNLLAAAHLQRQIDDLDRYMEKQ